MKRDLVNERQPFGEVYSTPMHAQTMPTPAAHSNANLGSGAFVGNNGATIVESFADKNPGAYEQATKGRSNPFGPVGHDFGVGITSKTENYGNGV